MTDKKDKKVVRNFSFHDHEVRYHYLDKQLEYYKQLIDLIKAIEPDCDNISELFEVINTKTGFKNTRMSFQALELENEYTRIQELKEASKDINPVDLTESLEFTQTFLKDLKEEFTTYWTKEQEQAMCAINKALSAFNNLPYEHRKLLGFNRNGELVRSPLFDRNFN